MASEEKQTTGLGGRARRRDGLCYTTGIVGAQHRGDRGGHGARRRGGRTI